MVSLVRNSRLHDEARKGVINVGSSAVQYQVYGQGEPLVLIHGLAGSTDWWVRNVGVLSRHYAVYLVDLPGFGAMRRYADQFSIRGAAVWLENLLTALSLEKASVVGHSMGGLIAAMFAARYRERVNKLVLAAPAIGLGPKKIAAFLIPLARQTLQTQPAFVPTLAWDTARAGFFTLLRASRELLSTDIAHELAGISAPCLLLWGERDPLVPVALSRDLQLKIRNSSLSVLRGAGHILMYDRAEEFNRAVLQFLE